MRTDDRNIQTKHKSQRLVIHHHVTLVPSSLVIIVIVVIVTLIAAILLYRFTVLEVAAMTCHTKSIMPIHNISKYAVNDGIMQ
jgi:flagellar basal body-associated protein FliL